MTARLVPYRSLRQVEADATLTAVALTLTFAAVRAFAHLDNVALNLLLCIGVYLGLSLISEAVHIWRARRRGAELMPYEAMLKRYLAEQADRTVLDAAGRTAMMSAYGLMVLLLAAVDIADWPMWTMAIVLVAALGSLCGVYNWMYACNYTNMAKKESPAPSPMIQIAMRHYAGYATGMAAALSVAVATRGTDLTALPGLAVLIAYFVGKLIADTTIPAVHYGSPTVPRTIGGVLAAFLLGLVWWGLPYGLLLALSMDVSEPNVGRDHLLVAITVTSAYSVVVTFIFLIWQLIVRGRPASKSGD